MSDTYFNTLPEELVVTILCNFTVDKSVHSIVKLLRPLNKEKLYRKISTRLFTELRIYPEEISINEISISWEKLYLSVSVYAVVSKKFNKFEFYYRCFSDETFLLMLYEYTTSPSDELTLFIDTIIIRDIIKISTYYKTYFSDVLYEINKKRTKLLIEKVKDFGLSSKVSTDSFGTYKIDSDGRTVLVKIYEEDNDIDIYIYFRGGILDQHELYKRGYLGWDHMRR